MFPVNCYILWDDTKEAAVIDPACFYEEERQAFKNFIEKEGLKLTRLLNTHLHIDHVFGNPFILREFGLKAEASQQDEFWLDQAYAQSRMFGLQMNEAPAPLGKYICDGDQIQFGHTVLEAIHVPGHSPGSMVYYCKEDGCLFSGDVLFQGSIGRADLTGGNSTNSENIFAAVCSYSRTKPSFTRDMELLPPSGMKKRRILFLDNI